MNKNSNWVEGQKVTGTYCGIAYSGRINSNTRPTPDHNNVIFCITLDQPIAVFGKERATVEIWTNGTDTIH